MLYEQPAEGRQEGGYTNLAMLATFGQRAQKPVSAQPDGWRQMPKVYIPAAPYTILP